MDTTDRKILALLQDDASLSVAEIAARVNLSQTPCWRRIQKLEEAGVIQRHVAREITALLHGEQAASRAVQASEALFAGDVHTIDADMLGEMSDVPAVDLPLNLLDDAGMSATDLLIAVELASSKRDAREHVGNAAVQVNGHKADSTTMVTRDDLLHGSVIFVRRGQREWRLARFE